MPRLIFINRYFFPDHCATSQLLSDLAFALAQSGWSVRVIASQQRYDDPKARQPSEETINRVDVHRVPSTCFGRSTLWGRAFDYFSFYRSAYHALRSLAGRGDIVIAKTDPPLMSIVAMLAARGACLVNWLQDLYPKVAVQLGVPLLKGPISATLSSLRDRSLNAAAANVVLERSMAERVHARGVPAGKIHIIPNWSNDEEIVPIPPGDNPLRRAWGLEDKFVVGYSGNLGRAHEFTTVLTAAERLRDHPHVVFLVIGGGHHFNELACCVRERGLAHRFRFRPYQDRAALAYSLCVPDAHWISLKPELEGLIVPSKLYGIAAAGRPIIAITASDGDIARLVRQHECGLTVEPGNAAGLADAVIRLSTDCETALGMGRRARAMLEARFTRRQALSRWNALLERVASQAKHATAPAGAAASLPSVGWAGAAETPRLRRESAMRVLEQAQARYDLRRPPIIGRLDHALVEQNHGHGGESDPHIQGAQHVVAAPRIKRGVVGRGY